ncbi:MAG: alpha/beta hydrolase, partial [Hyphomicrobiales bacterium]|nr:alpha/beta hydrolase [Hyphomicrobiales bacterium]MBV8664527.1 alpha/beta hydrolase [Hyphomicrobiales bacterium]
VSGYFFPTVRADAILTSPSAIPMLGDLMRETVTPLLARAMTKRTVEKMFEPREVPEQFWREFPLQLGYRPSQLRASQEETTMMAAAARRLSPHYAAIACPVSIIAGEKDAIADPGRQSAALHHSIPQSRLQVLRGAGHMVHYSASDVIAQAVLAAPATQRQSRVPTRGVAGEAHG